MKRAKRGKTAKRAKEAIGRRLLENKQAKQKLETAIEQLDRLFDDVGQGEGYANDALIAARKAGNAKAQRFAQQAAKAMNGAGNGVQQADRFLRQAWEAVDNEMKSGQ